MFDKAAKKLCLEKLKTAHWSQAKYIDFPSTCKSFITICFTIAFQAISMLKRTLFSSKDRSTARTENRKLNASVKNN